VRKRKRKTIFPNKLSLLFPFVDINIGLIYYLKEDGENNKWKKVNEKRTKLVAGGKVFVEQHRIA
jgi:hypothetical protein